MKKLITAIMGISTLALVSCSNKVKPPVAPESYAQTQTNSYVDRIATPMVISSVLGDPKTPTLGAEDAKQAVVVFFDYACGKCTEIFKRLDNVVDKYPNVKFIFKAYPSTKRDAKVANYASLSAYEAYLQGGTELFEKYNKEFFASRYANEGLSMADVNRVVKDLGIKLNQPELEQQAEEQELESRKLGKAIGFKGPHSMIILPTSLVDMSSEELSLHKKDIYVLPGSATSTMMEDNPEEAKWIVDNVEAHIKTF